MYVCFEIISRDDGNQADGSNTGWGVLYLSVYCYLILEGKEQTIPKSGELDCTR